MRLLLRKLDLLYCDVHNTLWAAWYQYVAYRRHALRPIGRFEAARLTWQGREFWDR